MTPKTFFDALQTAIKAMVWTGTSNKIFGENVHIVTDSPEALMSRFQPPSCFIKEGAGKPHPNHPYLIDQKFTLGFFVENLNSAWGTGVLDGANRTANTSRGAGLWDIETEAMGQIMKITTLSSAPVRIVKEGKMPTSNLKGNSPNVLRVWPFSVLVNLY